MANVAKSQKNWELIERNINKMFTEREQYARDWANYHSENDLFNLCYNAILTEEERNHMAALGSKFFSQRDELIFKVTVAGNEHSIHLKAGSKRSVPPHVVDNYYGQVKIPIKNPDPILAGAIQSRAEAIEACQKDLKTMIEKVKKMYDEAKSINMLVKIWQPAWDLLDHDIHERLRKKVPNRRGEPVNSLSAEDLKELNTAYTIAKISK